MSSYKEIGRKIQRAREDASLSQEELARLLGCTQSSLSNYELGKRRLYLTDLQRIGELLGKPITYFLEEFEEDGRSGDEYTLLKEPFIKDILYELREIKVAKRKDILDYVRWLSSQDSNLKK